MTPAARIAAAITLLDAILAGEAAERALTNWGRANRFAGSGDRAAVRDHVYDALRCRGSFASLGGSLSGRGLMLGLCRSEGLDWDSLFSGEAYAPAPLDPAEQVAVAAPVGAEAELCLQDWPEWLLPQLQADLGAALVPISQQMRHRAPVFLRVNRAKATPDRAREALALEGIEARPHPLCETALEVTAGARRIAQSKPYLQGMIELQDAASQAVLTGIDLPQRARVLDYCAGGGGKALALAALCPSARITAHDINPARMQDIGPRAARAGARITLAGPGRIEGKFDLVLVDAPCTGSGTWRRTPEAKWRLTPERLAELVKLQAEILRRASAHVAPGGRLLYMTCSLLSVENARQVEAFCAGQRFVPERAQQLTPLDGGDGFFGAMMRRS